jgi:hypothetical protein
MAKEELEASFSLQSLAYQKIVGLCNLLPICVPVSARQWGLLCDQRREWSLSAGALSEQSSGPPHTETEYRPC